MSSGSVQELLTKTKIDDVMFKPPISVNETDDFSIVQQKFVDHKLYYLCVINDKRELVGTISQKYLYKAQSPRRMLSNDLEYSPEIIIDGDSFYTKEILDSYILSNIMNRNLRTLNADQSMADAVSMMANNHIGCIPIVDEKNKLDGLITEQLVVKFLSDQLAS